MQPKKTKMQKCKNANLQSCNRLSYPEKRCFLFNVFQGKTPEQMIRMAGILLDIADGTKRDFDELIQEKRGTTYWVHFAVRPSGNRRKILFDCI